VNRGPSAPESSTLTIWLPSHPFKHEFVANLPVNMQRKNIENRLTFGEAAGRSLATCFLIHGVEYIQFNSWGSTRLHEYTSIQIS